VRKEDVRELGIDPQLLHDDARRGHPDHLGHGVYRMRLIPPDEWDELMEPAVWPAGEPCRTRPRAGLVQEPALPDGAVPGRTGRRESRPTDRARDLIDILLVHRLLDEDELAEGRQACVEIFRLRNRKPGPPSITVLPGWPELYATELARRPGSSRPTWSKRRTTSTRSSRR